MTDKQRQMPINMVCHKCGHIWEYKGIRRPTEKYNIMITCPRCYYKVPLKVNQ